MYLDHFGLSQPPFKITPNTGFFYAGGNRGAILDALLYAVIHGEGIVKVTGEIGSGKTMLCRMLESRLPGNVEAIYLANPSLNRDEVFHVIAGELGLATQGKRASETLRLIQDDLIEKHAAGRQAVLLVEEAQAMPLDTLEEIRLLSNLETAHHKLLQIVLFGQPELDQNLGLPRMRQLKERITHNFTVPPLAGKEIPEYLMFRLRAAGYRGPDLFGAGAIRLVAKASQGITRRINILADKALLAAFSLNTHAIGPKHVRAAIRDSGFSGAGAAGSSLKRAGLPVLLLGLGMALGAGWQGIFNRAPFVAAPAAKPSPRPPAAAPALPAAQPAIQEKPAPAPLPGLLQQRLEATRAWLKTEDEAHFSIQLMAVHADAEAVSRLERFFRRNAPELQRLYVYPSSLAGKSGFGVLFGNFAARDEALAALAGLPEEMKTGRPILRTVRGVKTETVGQGHGG